METVEQDAVGRYSSLFAAPRPRSVRIKTINQIILGAFPFGAILLIVFGLLDIRQARQLGAPGASLASLVLEFTFSAIIIAITCVIFWTVRRDRKLLRDGELAVGTVTHQKLVLVRGGRGGARKQSKIRYRFKDASGQMFQGTGTDHSRRLQVDMDVPVFFNPADPEENVAFCTASCELRSG